MKCTRDQLKARFETGDRPTQQDFFNLIDSFFNILDDLGLAVDLTNIVLTGNSGAPYYESLRFDFGNLVSHVASGNTQAIHLISGSTDASSYYNAVDNAYYFQVVGNSGTKVIFRNFDTGAKIELNPDGSVEIASGLISGTWQANEIISTKQIKSSVQLISASQTLDSSYRTVLVDTSGGNVTLDLDLISGLEFRIKKISSDGNLVIVQCTNQTEFAANKSWNTQGEGYIFENNATDYFITGKMQ